MSGLWNSQFEKISQIEWSFWKKLSFRFTFIYLFIYCLSTQFIFEFPTDIIWNNFVPWFAEYILFFEGQVSTEDYGSGDRLFDYLSIAVYTGLAFLFVVIWTIYDSKRINYIVLRNWLLVLIRFYVAYQMISYSLVKLFPIQFTPPSYSRLIQPVGDLQPIELFWTFMGYSRGYVVFSGVIELIGGLLLLHRKTTLLGAVITFAVMMQVLLLNFFYVIPVKLFSAHIVLMCGLIMLLHFKRLMNFFIYNKASEPVMQPAYFNNSKLNTARRYLKYPIIFGFLIYDNSWIPEVLQQDIDNQKLLIEEGYYEVNQINVIDSIGKREVPDSLNLKYFIVFNASYCQIGYANHTSKWGKYSVYPEDSEIEASFFGNENLTRLNFTMNEKQLFFKGKLREDSIYIQLQQKKMNDFKLSAAKHQWIIE